MHSIARERGRSAPAEFIALEPGMRERLEATIEALIALADALDGDTDLEAVSEDEGAQCEDEGIIDSGIADGQGLYEQASGYLPIAGFE